MRCVVASVLLSLSAILALHCGSTSRKSVRDKRFVDVKAREAIRLAPDLVDRARGAHNQALLAEKRGERVAAQAYSTSAELLFEAARIEVERIEIERRRLSVQKRADRAKGLEVRHLRAHQKVEREVALIEATRNAQARDSLVLQQTQEGSKKGQSRRAQRAARERSSALALNRARLYLAGAVALGADDRFLEAARRAIREAESQPVGSASCEQRAEQALLFALDALGSARAKNDGPTRDEATTLLDEAQKMGLPVELLPTGLIVNLPGLFIGRSSGLSDRGRVELKKLSYLVRAHPHGAIEIRLHAGSTDRLSRERLAKARAGRIVSSLSSDRAKQDRFQVAFDAFAPGNENSAKLVFVAYSRLDK